MGLKVDELVGQRFGRWVVLERVENKGKALYYNCRCDCGNEKDVAKASLLGGASTSCGCLRAALDNSRIVDLTGKVFGRLYVIERDFSYEKGSKIHWICRCSCGNIISVRSCSLIEGKTRSCGCFTKDLGVLRFTTHGLSHTRRYRIFRAARYRCMNPKSKVYKYYGGKGIKICDEWLKDFSSFYVWAAENGYKENLTLDRIDNDGNYCPENCRWVSQKEQIRNTSRNIFIEVEGESRILAEWSELTGVKSQTINMRYKAGKSGTDLFIPVNKCSKKVTLGKVRLRSIYSGVKDRCYNSNNKDYCRYGAKGIVMCEEWKENFETFYNWAIISKYKDALSLDRIDNNKGYFPENCRWATIQEQAENKRSCVYLTHEGRTQTQTAWSRETGIGTGALRYRVLNGLPEDKIFYKGKLSKLNKKKV